MRRVTTFVFATLLTSGLGYGCDGEQLPVDAVTSNEQPRDGQRAGEGDVEAVSLDTNGEAMAAGVCNYVNLFSNEKECKAYTGEGWTVDAAEADCAAPMAGSDGVYSSDGVCAFDAELGHCIVDSEDGLGYTLVLAGADPASCGMAASSCSGFLAGAFQADPRCDESSAAPEPGQDPFMLGVFIPPYESCEAPREGEAEGMGPDGQVCTQVAISGCTEPGRRFEDYGDCDVVRSQRPYYPADTTPEFDDNDPRLEDEAYLSDVAWVTEQVEACACVCCHTTRLAPSGVSSWDSDAGPLWLDSIPDGGLAMLAGMADSAAFGAYPSEVNNGFDREVIGMPTTDPERMREILTREFLNRGLSMEWGESVPPFGGPLASQLTYEPQACKNGEGVAADGTVSWGNFDVRYVYILEADAGNPGVPPNLDLPEGTLWRVDAAYTSAAMEGGIQYGTPPASAFQAYPTTGRPAELEVGQSYYIYALVDVGFPITRCIFEFPAQ